MGNRGNFQRQSMKQVNYFVKREAILTRLFAFFKTLSGAYQMCCVCICVLFSFFLFDSYVWNFYSSINL